ncbi:MAG: aldehyde dehydrogenase [Clostridiales Family XIII bacterium]|uniref:aldehyde dehydrogenase n=1 Tax=Hominibacterium faecale TaxID=2839743 RepID=UPI0022B29F60|nr:aldehyde dehydrogenase [Hominibacterium faecale]MCI7303108.1 aldehyde dehydrogenase [Clostridia bacterium]MDE8734453.1 aldehyde dehydrogenase [Eubacteriales bacterium DFI.9.88]MDY3012337.1 aldehyde dehydrogenase [Clostridiales Family XIII bacterium]
MRDIKEILDCQKAYFKTGATRSIAARESALESLKNKIRSMEYEILEALKQDLGKSAPEGYMSEVGMVLEEISYMQKHLKGLAKEKRVKTPLVQFHSKSYVKPCPYGTVLIMSPWNYPFLLTMAPLVDALAAGNTAILKPGNASAHTSRIMARLVEKTFSPQLVTVVEGGREANSLLLEQKFDYIFFTGGKTVGRLVMEKAARHLTPVSLELGGKSPCVVDETANLPLAAKRIVFGKFLNLGQTCVAPDYLLVQRNVKDELLAHIEKAIRIQFGTVPLANSDYGNIINEKHFQRLIGLIQGQTARIGGKYDDCRRMEPTVLTDVTMESPVMQEEIFGPVLPVLEFDDIEEAIKMIEKHPTPLALYVFTQNKSVKEKLTEEIAFGGGCINDTIIHLASTSMGFGGVGESGMGAYHGKTGFDTFTHYKSLVDKKTWIDLPFRYAPYTRWKTKIVRAFIK